MSSLYDPIFPLLDAAACEFAAVGAVSTDLQAQLDEAGYDLSRLPAYLDQCSSKGTYRFDS